MQEKKLSRKEVEDSIRGSLADDIISDEIVDFTTDDANIIELTADMEVNNDSASEEKNVFSELPESQINPFAQDEKSTDNVDGLEDKVEKAIQKWLDENLHKIVAKEIEEEFKRIHEENE